MSFDLSPVLHAGRTANLARTRADGKVLVSIGAAGQWYFDWIDATCGAPARHIGVEYYSAPPAVLPDNVEWVANTAGSMPDVESGVADLLVSGQNIEHLWQEEVAGFLAEAHRVLRPGGRMIIDSPNRAITQIYGGAHPEHMVELTVDEAEALVTAAGFDVQRVAGILLCRDGATGEVLPIDGLADISPPTLVFRSVAAIDDAENSYLWWIEAVRADREPDMARVQEIIARYWATGWPERMDRLVTTIGKPETLADGRLAWQSGIGDNGPLSFGPYAPIKAGRYRTTLNVMRTTDIKPGQILGHVDVIFDDGSIIECRTELTGKMLPKGEWKPITLEFELADMRFGFQNRLFSYGVAGLRVERRLTFTAP
ncbi:methyltransferase domain-containing protein [Brevundimonas subvibrioides]|uniref:methyltransferase domain-containing protein n=1 Tax=Brevundimonas subvibrioides TaxID=74313 RepID=UPI0022B47A3E|nr:class I SAM-dependent methyltransferase [Brevundimonas subvibrioides]